MQEKDLKRLHEGAIKNDPFISKSLGPNAKIERMKAASLRLGGQGLLTTHDDHLIIVGDAAGHIDPLTGEGIHTAIMVSRAGLVACCPRPVEARKIEINGCSCFHWIQEEAALMAVALKLIVMHHVRYRLVVPIRHD